MTSNSFSSNTTTGSVRLFPLGFTLLAAESGVFRTWLHAQSLREVVDLIVGHALGAACIFEISPLTLDPATNDVRPVEDVAKDAGVRIAPLDADAWLLATADLPRLLDRLEHFNLQFLDVAPASTPDAAYRAVLDAAECRGHASPPALHFAQGSRLFFASHDDCYLYLETRERRHALAHFARLLQEFVAARVGIESSRVAPPPEPLLESLIAATGSCTMFDAHATLEGSALRLGYDRRRYRLGDPAVTPEARIRYDLSERSWGDERP